MRKLSKRFQIKVIKDRELIEQQYVPNPERKKDDKATPFVLKEVTRKVPESYMVFFPMGHSVYFESREQMVRAGVVASENFTIDLDTGEAIEEAKHTDLEALVRSRTQFDVMGV